MLHALGSLDQLLLDASRASQTQKAAPVDLPAPPGGQQDSAVTRSPPSSAARAVASSALPTATQVFHAGTGGPPPAGCAPTPATSRPRRRATKQSPDRGPRSPIRTARRGSPSSPADLPACRPSTGRLLGIDLAGSLGHRSIKWSFQLERRRTGAQGGRLAPWREAATAIAAGSLVLWTWWASAGRWCPRAAARTEALHRPAFRPSPLSPDAGPTLARARGGRSGEPPHARTAGRLPRVRAHRPRPRARAGDPPWAAGAVAAPFPEGDAGIGTDAAVIALKTLFDPVLAAGLEAHYEPAGSAATATTRVADEGNELARGSGDAPDAVIATDPATLGAVLWHGRQADGGRAGGRSSISGNRAWPSACSPVSAARTGSGRAARSAAPRHTRWAPHALTHAPTPASGRRGSIGMDADAGLAAHGLCGELQRGRAAGGTEVERSLRRDRGRRPRSRSRARPWCAFSVVAIWRWTEGRSADAGSSGPARAPSPR